jgi:hypothetical protein
MTHGKSRPWCVLLAGTGAHRPRPPPLQRRPPSPPPGPRSPPQPFPKPPPPPPPPFNPPPPPSSAVRSPPLRRRPPPPRPPPPAPPGGHLFGLVSSIGIGHHSCSPCTVRYTCLWGHAVCSGRVQNNQVGRVCILPTVCIPELTSFGALDDLLLLHRLPCRWWQYPCRPSSTC